MRLLRPIAACLAFFTLGLTHAHAQVAASLVAIERSAQPGRPVTVALELRHDAGWHTYWENAGTGYPTSLTWKLPPGWKAGDIQWPVPEIIRDRLGGVSGNGYSGTLLLPVTLTPPADAPVGTVVLEAKADWLMCEQKCVPGSAQVRLELPVSATPPARNDAIAAQLAKQAAPQPAPNATATLSPTRATLRIANAAGWKEPHFFSTDGLVQFDQPQETRADGADLVLDLPRATDFAEKAEALRGVVAYADSEGRRQGAKVDVPFGVATSTAPRKSLIGTVWLAWLGGLILNLMPCVFPVIGIKILGFVNQAGADRRKVTLHGAAFSLGVLVSFWLLAGLLALLRAGGSSVGWGFQLQSPEFVFLLSGLMLAFGLSMSGVFEFGLQATSIGSGLQSRSGLGGSFFSGVLATVVATPCSAPLIGPVLGVAIALPFLEGLVVFTAIGAGLATPYLILSLFPKLAQAMPRPGAWMETFKQFMAFPLYATSGYLVWVLAGQASETSLRNALFGLVLIAMAAWVYGRFCTFGAAPGRARKGLIATLALLAAGVALGWPRPEKLAWKPWSAEAVAAARADKRLVYVDFTARWCATCQTNKALVFKSQEVLDLLREKQVVLLRGDWTNRDPAITAELARFDRSAVPFNLIYRPGETEPRVLPEILTASTVLDALR